MFTYDGYEYNVELTTEEIYQFKKYRHPQASMIKWDEAPNFLNSEFKFLIYNYSICNLNNVSDYLNSITNISDVSYRLGLYFCASVEYGLLSDKKTQAMLALDDPILKVAYQDDIYKLAGNSINYAYKVLNINPEYEAASAQVGYMYYYRLDNASKGLQYLLPILQRGDPHLGDLCTLMKIGYETGDFKLIMQALDAYEKIPNEAKANSHYMDWMERRLGGVEAFQQWLFGIQYEIEERSKKLAHNVENKNVVKIEEKSDEKKDGKVVIDIDTSGWNWGADEHKLVPNKYEIEQQKKLRCVTENEPYISDTVLDETDYQKNIFEFIGEHRAGYKVNFQQFYEQLRFYITTSPDGSGTANMIQDLISGADYNLPEMSKVTVFNALVERENIKVNKALTFTKSREGLKYEVLNSINVEKLNSIDVEMIGYNRSSEQSKQEVILHGLAEFRDNIEKFFKDKGIKFADYKAGKKSGGLFGGVSFSKDAALAKKFASMKSDAEFKEALEAVQAIRDMHIESVKAIKISNDGSYDTNIVSPMQESQEDEAKMMSPTPLVKRHSIIQGNSANMDDMVSMMRYVVENAKKIEHIEGILHDSGIDRLAAVKNIVRDMQENAPEMYDYWQTFYWYSMAMFRAYEVIGSGMVKQYDRNIENNKQAMMHLVNKGASVASKLTSGMPILGSALGALDMVVEKLYTTMQDNKLQKRCAEVNNVMRAKFLMEDDMNISLGTLAIGMAKLRELAVNQSRDGDVDIKAVAWYKGLMKSVQVYDASSQAVKQALEDVVKMFAFICNKADVIVSEKSFEDYMLAANKFSALDACIAEGYLAQMDQVLTVSGNVADTLGLSNESCAIS